MATGDAAPAARLAARKTWSPREGVVAWLEREPALGLALVLAVLPWIVPQKTLAIDILVFSLLISSFNLLLGYAGVLSLGHATFFGVGAYAAGVLLAKTGIVDLWLALLMSVAVPALLAVPIGWFSLRRRLLYFTMLTLAFNQMVYFVALQARGLTGGDDGLRGIVIPPLQLPGITIPLDSLINPYNYYYVAYVIVVLCLLLIERLVQSPFGRALEAIRENEERALMVGYDTNRLQLMVFVLSAALAGLAGGMHAMAHSFASLDSLTWILGTGIIIMTVLGGKGTIVGPIVGVIVYLSLQEYISRITESWQLVVGILFVVLVIFLPGGMWGSFKTWYRARRSDDAPPRRNAAKAGGADVG